MSERFSVVEGYSGPLIYAANPETRELVSSAGMVIPEALGHRLLKVYKSLLPNPSMHTKPWPPFLPSPESVRVSARSLYEALRELKGETK